MTEELKTTAWNCLPKEFKEEVKALYAKARNIYAIYTSATCINNTESKAIDIWNGKMQVLRELFGEHNLTSDTEGEDMLIISRKAAEEFYDKYFGKKMCEVNRSILREDFTTLFGGKCRVGEDDVIKTKPKFKVGDLVTVHLLNGESLTGNQLRIMVAAEAMKGMLANPNIIMSCGCLEDNKEYITNHAVEYADALLAEINGKGGGDERK